MESNPVPSCAAPLEGAAAAPTKPGILHIVILNIYPSDETDRELGEKITAPRFSLWFYFITLRNRLPVRCSSWLRLFDTNFDGFASLLRANFEAAR